MRMDKFEVEQIEDKAKADFRKKLQKIIKEDKKKKR
jgi:hypothetical protein